MTTAKQFSPLKTVNKKWFVNLTKNNIPHSVQTLLQLDQNFSLPPNNTQNNIIQLIKNIENNIIKLYPDTQIEIRNKTIPTLHNLKSPLKLDHTEQKILKLLNITNTFIKNNPNIIYTKTDKGNITVALNKTDYVNKIEDMLSDKSTLQIHAQIDKDPIKKLTGEIRDFLMRWKTKDYISNATYNSIYCSDDNLPRAYGLPKIHKPGCTFRLIISSIDSPTYQLANYIHKIISKNTIKPLSHTDNSYKLIHKLKDVAVDVDYDLVSLDVVSLFTNIPTNLALDSVDKRCDQISKDTKIPKLEFIFKRFEKDSTFFTFNGKIYEQLFGTPMGSPIIANIVMDDIETRVLNSLRFKIPFYCRYVDIALAIPRSKAELLLDTFNSFHPRLQFTLEKGGNILNFLDVTIIKNNNNLEFDFYTKPTFSGRFLSYMSQHSISQKRGNNECY